MAVPIAEENEGVVMPIMDKVGSVLLVEGAANLKVPIKEVPD